MYEAASVDRLKLILQYFLGSHLVQLVCDILVNLSMKLVKLGYILLEEVFVAAIVILEDHLVPLLTNPALHSVHPVCAFLNLFVTKDAREDDLLHVASHRILHE